MTVAHVITPKLLHKEPPKPKDNGPGGHDDDQARQESVSAASEHTNPPRLLKNVPILLQVIPITIYGPNGCLNTHAMLDNGSTCSLVLASVADKLGLEGSQERIVLNGIQGQSELISKQVSMQVSPVNKVSPRCDVSRALVVNSLNVPQKRVNLADLKSKWSHLKDLDIADVVARKWLRGFDADW